MAGKATGVAVEVASSDGDSTPPTRRSVSTGRAGGPAAVTVARRASREESKEEEGKVSGNCEPCVRCWSPMDLVQLPDGTLAWVEPGTVSCNPRVFMSTSTLTSRDRNDNVYV